VEAESVNAQVAGGRTDWEVVLRAESGGAQSGVSKRDPEVGIHDCVEISAGGHLSGLRCYCESHVARESTDVLAGEHPAHPKLVARHRG